VKTDTFETALAIFRRHGGVLRTSEAIRQGIHPRTLYAMRNSGEIQSLSRGLTAWLICHRFPILTW
jgi:hypothetical protein